VYVTVYRSSATSSDGMAASTAAKLWGLLSCILVHMSDVSWLYSPKIRLIIRVACAN
jgi:hypothetical protein